MYQLFPASPLSPHTLASLLPCRTYTLSDPMPLPYMCVQKRRHSGLFREKAQFSDHDKAMQALGCVIPCPSRLKLYGRVHATWGPPFDHSCIPNTQFKAGADEVITTTDNSRKGVVSIFLLAPVAVNSSETICATSLGLRGGLASMKAKAPVTRFEVKLE